MKLYLEDFFQKKIDLVEKDFINKNLKKYLEKDKILIF
jgi:predicted nucleotidyltransferase